MRRIIIVALCFVASACGKVNTFTDGGGGDDISGDGGGGTPDAKPGSPDAIPCEAEACNGTADGCCPSACNGNNDADCPATCDNGVIENGETCDPLSTCPGACPSVGCQLRQLDNPGTCNAACSNAGLIQTCTTGDSCCPAGCTANNDGECAAVCGNGTLESGELCDGNCPTSCPQQGCQLYQLIDNGPCQQQCVAGGQQGTCQSGDGCCPAGCNAVNDNDCAPFCGNSVVEPGETCDGNCTVQSEPWPSGWTSTGSAATCNIQYHVPVQTCVQGDGICPFIGGTGGTDCNINDDRDCLGPRWQYREITWAPQSWAVGVEPTVNIYGFVQGDSVLFTTCRPAVEADPTDTAIFKVVDQQGVQLVGFSDDSWWGPNPVYYGQAQQAATLPMLAGWDCSIAPNVYYRSTAPIAPGGLILGPNTFRLQVTYGHYSNTMAGNAKLFVWWSGTSNPNAG